jgi:hypothetical protein
MLMLCVEKASRKHRHPVIARCFRKRWSDDRLYPGPGRDDGRRRRRSGEQRPGHMGTGGGPVDSRALASTSARNRRGRLSTRCILAYVGLCVILVRGAHG